MLNQWSINKDNFEAAVHVVHSHFTAFLDKMENLVMQISRKETLKKAIEEKPKIIRQINKAEIQIIKAVNGVYDNLWRIWNKLSTKAKREGKWGDVCDMQRARLKGLQEGTDKHWEIREEVRERIAKEVADKDSEEKECEEVRRLVEPREGLIEAIDGGVLYERMLEPTGEEIEEDDDEEFFAEDYSYFSEPDKIKQGKGGASYRKGRYGEIEYKQFPTEEQLVKLPWLQTKDKLKRELESEGLSTVQLAAETVDPYTRISEVRGGRAPQRPPLTSKLVSFLFTETAATLLPHRPRTGDRFPTPSTSTFPSHTSHLPKIPPQTQFSLNEMLSLYQQLDTLIYHTNKLLKQYIFIQSNSHPTLYNRRLVEIFSYLEVNCNAFFSLLVRIGICFHNIFRYSKVEMDWHIQRIIGLKLTVQNLMATPLLGAVRLSKFNIFYHNAFQSLHDIQRREIDFIHYPDLEVIISDLIGKFESTDFEDSSVVAFLQIFLTKLWVLLYRGLKKLQILIIHRTENDKIQSIISLLRLLYRVETLLRSDCVPFTVSELNERLPKHVRLPEITVLTQQTPKIDTNGILTFDGVLQSTLLGVTVGQQTYDLQNDGGEADLLSAQAEGLGNIVKSILKLVQRVNIWTETTANLLRRLEAQLDVLLHFMSNCEDVRLRVIEGRVTELLNEVRLLFGTAALHPFVFNEALERERALVYEREAARRRIQSNDDTEEEQGKRDGQ